MVLETEVQSQVESYQILKKKKQNKLNAALLNTQHYKGKLEQSKERRSAFPYTSV